MTDRDDAAWARTKSGRHDGDICDHCDAEPIRINTHGELLCPDCATRFADDGVGQPLSYGRRSSARPCDQPRVYGRNRR